MKTNAAELLAILENDNLSFFNLVKLDWNNTYYYTDFPSDVTFNGQVYSKTSPLVKISQAQYTTTVDRELFSLTASALDTTIKNEVEAGIVHMPVDLYMAFAIGGVPQLGVNDVMHYYSGSVITTSELIGSEEKLMKIDCSAPLSDLDARGTIFTTKNGMSLLNPADTSFDSISEGHEEISLKWGKV